MNKCKHDWKFRNFSCKDHAIYYCSKCLSHAILDTTLELGKAIVITIDVDEFRNNKGVKV